MGLPLPVGNPVIITPQKKCPMKTKYIFFCAAATVFLSVLPIAGAQANPSGGANGAGTATTQALGTKSSIDIHADIRKPLLFSQERIEEMRAKPQSVEALKKECEVELEVKAAPVAVLEPVSHYNTKGVAHDPAEEILKHDATMAYNAAVCYALTNDTRYALHAQQIIGAWASTLKEVKGGQGDSACNFYMPLMIIAASVVRDVGDWNDAEFKVLLDKTVRYTSHDNHKNNHGTWGVFLDSCIGFYLGDEALVQKAQNRWNELICHQVDKDGVLFLELTRSNTNNWNGGPDKGVNGIHYTHYTLLAATLSAENFRSQGRDLYSMEGGEYLRRAFVKGAALVLNPETSPYYESNHGVLNGVYGDAGYVPVLNKRYPCEAATALLKQHKLQDGGFLLLFDK